MSPSTILAAYALALAAVFGAAVGVGRLVGPVGTVVEAEHPAGEHAGTPQHGATDGEHR